MPKDKNKYDTEYNRRMFPEVVEGHKRKKRGSYGIINRMRSGAASSRKLRQSQRESGKTVFGKIAEYVPEWAR